MKPRVHGDGHSCVQLSQFGEASSKGVVGLAAGMSSVVLDGEATPSSDEGSTSDSTTGYSDSFAEGSDDGITERTLQKTVYTTTRLVGEGVYGHVWAGIASGKKTEQVAIKHIDRVFRCKRDAVRVMRELRLLRLLKHPRIVELKSVALPIGRTSFDDLHMVFDLFDTDLDKMIRSATRYDESHVKWISYQVLQGLEHMHSAGVIHRDLKPGNILVSSNCDIRIADLGMSRAVVEGDSLEDRIGWSSYVASRWYRAPELLIAGRRHNFSVAPYSSAIDVWALGCIVAELWTRQPAFAGRTPQAQLDLINRGLESDASFEDAFGGKMYSGAGRELLRHMLEMAPSRRVNAAAALGHPYFERLQAMRAAQLPKACGAARLIQPSDFAFESDAVTTVKLREIMYAEAALYSKPSASNIEQ